ncbi:MAG TPA: ABC transporter ATP-binding protein, partial [Stenotrophomonas sp.]|nr:ABC transporter ATP-binding protein [Stenotrophomonas sp.]
MSSDALIRVEGLGKRYDMFAKPVDRLMQLMTDPVRRGLGMAPAKHSKEVWALRGVSFEVPPGEALGVMGRNGSGKSTMLQMLCGTLTPTEGHVQVRGRIAALLELGAGFNPEFT